MSLLDRFRPKWQHSDTDVRAAAVRHLGKDDAELLGAVAQSDPDARVRRIAVKKLDNPKLLLEIGTHDEDEHLRSFALERANAILVEIATWDEDEDQSKRAVALLNDSSLLVDVVKAAQFEAIRHLALERLTDEKALTEVVRDSEDAVLGAEALRKITDPDCLRTIALEENGELAIEAVEKIDDLDILNALFEDRSTHKSARGVARDKLEALATDDHPFRQKQRRAEQLQLCQEMEALLRVEELEGAVDAVKKAQSQWEKLSEIAGVDEKLQLQFDESCEAVLHRKALVDKHAAEQLERDKALENDVAQRTALCEKVEQLTEDNVVEALAETRAEWQRLGPITNEQAKTLAKRFAEVAKKVQDRHEESAAWRELETHLESLISETERLARESGQPDASKHLLDIKKRWTELVPSTPRPGHEEDYQALDSRFQEAVQSFAQHQEQERERRHTQKQKTLEQTQELIKKLDAFCEMEELNLKQAFREFI